MTTEPGTLYVVATPIGNLDDLSPRAGQILVAAEVVVAEDTRRARQLLTRLGSSARPVSLHEHNESARLPGLLRRLRDGEDLALISDAGTPLVSDPGYRLLAAAREQGLPVSPVPGSCAVIAALCVSGLPTDRFRFEGFLPPRQAARRKRLVELSRWPETTIVFVPVHRADAVLADVERSCGPDRPVALARELTKLHETLYRGSISEVRAQLAADPGAGKGELTLVVAGAEPSGEPAGHALERMLAVLLEELPASRAAGLAARLTGVSRARAYAAAQRLKT